MKTNGFLQIIVLHFVFVYKKVLIVIVYTWGQHNARHVPVFPMSFKCEVTHHTDVINYVLFANFATSYVRIAESNTNLNQSCFLYCEPFSFFDSQFGELMGILF